MLDRWQPSLVALPGPVGYLGAMLSEGSPVRGEVVPPFGGDDAALVAAVAAGDTTALAALYDLYAPRLLGVARRMLGDRAAAEDLLHDVFLEVWRRAAEYAPTRGTVSAWLLVRTRSRCLDRLGRGARHALVVAQVAGESSLALDAHATAVALDGARVQRLVARLPAELVAVLELAYFDGLSTSEIAERLGIPPGTVKSRTARALSLLREAIQIHKEPLP
jgi:RNA polymerase sigma-70 factor (ECF subfamily)